MSFIVFDTEDDSKELMEAGKSGFDKKVTQIAAITRNGKTFYNNGNVTEFLRWISQQKERIVYAHNLQYDIGNLFGNELDSFDMVMVGGRLIKVSRENITFVDSFNIWPMSVKKLGSAFGLQKLQTDSMADDREYVFRDCEIVRRAMDFVWGYCERMELKRCPATLGGLSVMTWKKMGGKNCHDTNSNSRQALYGGRVELFKRVNETNKLAWTDINSLYPFVMLGEYPDRLEEFGSRLPEYGVADVTITMKESAFGYLPFKANNSRIFYPFGQMRGTWTIPEITYALEHGGKIDKVHNAYGSATCSRPYSDFVRNVFDLRLKAESDAENLFFKLLLNNLYGRLGATGVISRGVWSTESNRNKGVGYGEKRLVEYQMPPAEETNWCHAAYVTSYGRIELMKYIELIGVDNMIYSDTDSTIFECGNDKLPFKTGNELGQMKLVSWENECETYAPKMYHAGKVWKAKGVPQKLAKQYITNGHVEFDLPFKMREAIRFYDRANSKRLSVWRNVVKANHANYDIKKLVGNRYYACSVRDIC